MKILLKTYFTIMHYEEVHLNSMGIIFISAIFSYAAIQTQFLSLIWFAIGITFISMFMIISSADRAFSDPLLYKDKLDLVSCGVLENSLPIGRKTYLVSKILFIITLGFISIILFIPPLASLLYLFYKPYKLIFDLSFHLKIFFLIYILIIITHIIGFTLKAINNLGKKSDNRKRDYRIVMLLYWLIIFPIFVGRNYIAYNSEIVISYFPILLGLIALITFALSLFTIIKAQSLDLYK